MKPTFSRKTIAVLSRFSIGLVAIAGFAFAQSQMPQQDQTPHQWRTFDQTAPAHGDVPQAAPAQGDQSAPPAPQVFADQQGGPGDPNQLPTQVSPAQPQAPPLYPGQPGNYPPPPPNANYGNYGYGQPAPPQPVPAHLTIKPGTYVTVRINQYLSSDRNQTGDAFAATLAQPLVVDGVVVAQRGQTIGGRVSEAQKAGRVEGTSRLALQLTDLTLADGTNVPIQSQMINRNGPTSIGRDAVAIGGTTAVGAAIGAGVGAGQGAAIGAGAGAAVGILGVLLTRGRPTIIYPESTLTFRIDSAVDIATDHAPQAFRYASQQDYGTGYGAPGPRPAYGASPYGAPYGAGYGPAPVAAAPYPYYGGGYGYGYPYYPYYPGFGVFIGPGFYGRGFYGGGFRGGFRR
jgi:hypothetical protein